MSAATCAPGWGDRLSAFAVLNFTGTESFTAQKPRPHDDRLLGSPHPAARFARVDPPPPGEGGERRNPIRRNKPSARAGERTVCVETAFAIILP